MKNKIKLNELLTFIKNSENMYFLEEKNINLLEESCDFIINGIKNNYWEKNEYKHLSEAFFNHNAYSSHISNYLKNKIFSDKLSKSLFFKYLSDDRNILKNNNNYDLDKYTLFIFEKNDIDYIYNQFKNTHNLEEKKDLLVFFKLAYFDYISPLSLIKHNDLNRLYINEKIENVLMNINQDIINDNKLSDNEKKDLLVNTWIHSYFIKIPQIDNNLNYLSIMNKFNIFQYADKEQKGRFISQIISNYKTCRNLKIPNLKIYKDLSYNQFFEFDLIINPNKQTTYEEFILKENIYKTLQYYNQPDLSDSYKKNIESIFNIYKQNKNPKLNIETIYSTLDYCTLENMRLMINSENSNKFINYKVELKEFISNYFKDINLISDIQKNILINKKNKI